MPSFTTEFGHEIEFVPGYFERNKSYAYYTKGTQLHKGLQVLTGEPLGGGAPAKDWVQYASLVYFMERWGLMKKRPGALPIAHPPYSGI